LEQPLARSLERRRLALVRPSTSEDDASGFERGALEELMGRDDDLSQADAIWSIDHQPLSGGDLEIARIDVEQLASTAPFGQTHSRDHL